ncbi:endoribonuclease YbeY-like, partial [Pteropus vampyrus]|uniref:Endoribonuclease YbeY-like n=1 Tax=Pteropus vampyrus TaxID=132908 RepID=A0A6P6C5H5_PTEVA
QQVTATHGLCHLLGFTHNTEAEWQKMHQKEKQILEELGRRLGARLQPLRCCRGPSYIPLGHGRASPSSLLDPPLRPTDLT